MRFRRNLQFAISMMLIVLFLAGCGAPVATPTPIPPTRTPLPPLPTPEPAGEFVSGVSQIPEGEQLHLEWWESRSGESLKEPGCLKTELEGAWPPVCKCRLEGSLRESTPAVIGKLRIVGAGSGDLGGWISSEAHEIDGLPYTFTTARGDVVVHAVDAEGVIVAESGGVSFWVEPGQSWMYRVEDESDPACNTITTFRLTNNGWLDDCEYDCQ
jgi:hypothetical protein